MQPPQQSLEGRRVSELDTHTGMCLQYSTSELQCHVAPHQQGLRSLLDHGYIIIANQPTPQPGDDEPPSSVTIKGPWDWTNGPSTSTQAGFKSPNVCCVQIDLYDHSDWTLSLSTTDSTEMLPCHTHAPLPTRMTQRPRSLPYRNGPNHSSRRDSLKQAHPGNAAPHPHHARKQGCLILPIRAKIAAMRS